MTPAEIVRVFDWYSPDLPQHATFQQEIHRWSMFCQDRKDKPSPLFDALILVTRIITQTFAKSSTFSLTMPIGSVPCEGSFFCFEAFKAMEQNNNGQG